MVEDFAGDYTKVENDGCTFALTSTRCTSSGLTRTTDNSYVYKDFGADYFDGDFEFEFEIYVDECQTSSTQYNRCQFVVLCNQLGDFAAIRNTSEMAFLYLDGESGVHFKAGNRDGDGGGDTGDQVTISIDTLYYLTMSRSGSTLTIDIYSDAGKTSLVGTTSVNLDSGFKFRYLMPMQSLDLLTAYDCDSYIQNLFLGGTTDASKDLFAEFRVSSTDDKDLEAEFTVGQDTEALLAEFIIQNADTKDLYADFTPIRAATKDLQAELIPIHTATKDLQTDFMINQFYVQLKAEFLIRKTATKDLKGYFLISDGSVLVLQEDSKVRKTLISGSNAAGLSLKTDYIRGGVGNIEAARAFYSIIYCRAKWLKGKYIRARHSKSAGGTSTNPGSKVYVEIYDGIVDYTVGGNPPTGWAEIQEVWSYQDVNEYAYRVDEGQADFVINEEWVSLVLWLEDLNTIYGTAVDIDYLQINEGPGGADNKYEIDYDDTDYSITWETSGSEAHGYLDTPAYYDPYWEALLFAKLYITPHDDAELPAEFKVTQPGSADLQAEFQLAQIEDLQAEFTIRQTATRDLKGYFNLGGFEELAAYFDVGQDSLNLYTKFITQNSESQDIQAEFISRQSASRDLYAQFTSQVTVNLFADFTVRQAASEEILAEFISRQEIVTDVFAKLVIQQTDTKELFSDFRVRNSDYQQLYVKAEIRQPASEELQSRFTVRKSNAINLYSAFTVRNSDYQQLKAVLIIRNRDTRDLYAKFITQATESLYARFITRNSESINLYAVLEIAPFADLFSKLIVRKKNRKRLLAEFKIRKTATKGLQTEAFITRPGSRDLLSVFNTSTVNAGPSTLEAEFYVRPLWLQQAGGRVNGRRVTTRISGGAGGFRIRNGAKGNIR